MFSPLLPPLPLRCARVFIVAVYFPSSLLPSQPEELTLLLIKLRRQQAELNSVRERTVAQLMQLNMDGDNPKVRPLETLLQACVLACGVRAPSLTTSIIHHDPEGSFFRVLYTWLI